MSVFRRVLALFFSGATVFVVPLAVYGDRRSFDLDDPTGSNVVQLTIDAPAAAVAGFANRVRGAIEYDPDNPGATRGSARVAADSIILSNPRLNKQFREARWLDVENYPDIVFEIRQARLVKRLSATECQLRCEGRLTLRGVTKPLTLLARVSYLEGGLRKRDSDRRGDLIRVRAQAKIRRGDFGLRPGYDEERIGDAIEIYFSVAAAAERR